MRLFGCAALVTLSIAVASGQTASSYATLRNLTADSTRPDGPTIHVRGNVVITTNDSVITADEADFNGDAQELRVRGNIRVRQVGPPRRALGRDEQDVVRADEAYRMAKVHNDVPVLERFLDEGFVETNQNGNTRTKVETINLWRTFKIASLTTDAFDVRLVGNTAVVSGTQTEENAGGVDRMLFMRTFVRASDGWKLLASMQQRNLKEANLVRILLEI